jgi:hypothetical protein
MIAEQEASIRQNLPVRRPAWRRRLGAVRRADGVESQTIGLLITLNPIQRVA